RLGIPPVLITDGPHGLRKQKDSQQGFGTSDTVPATCFPTACTLASTWNRDLMRAVGAALAEEARTEQVGVVLGPGVNIKRSPLCGRNFEYFSEDPYLSGALAAAYIQGVQSKGVGASLKHFAANNQEHRRFTIDAIVDERALREIYFASFEEAIKAEKPWTVMAAYNRLNGEFCSEHSELLTSILREEWGFEGLVMSDWGAVNQRAAGLTAGLDLEMPGLKGVHDERVIQAVNQGELPMEVLDRAVERVLRLIDKAAVGTSDPGEGDKGDHHELARLAASEGAVLLKNAGGILPLAIDQKVAVIGEFAKQPRYQGAGSSLVNPTQMDNAYNAIAERVGGAEKLGYASGYHSKTISVDEALIKEALEAVQQAEVVLVFAGLPDSYESEGVDREDMRMPEQHNALIEAVAAVNPNTVVVLMNGAPVEMPWHNQVRAILEAYLGGQAGGSAIAQLLYGEVNPSGKLAETFPLRWQDHPAYTCFPGGPRTVEYRESIYVGYRYYDTAEKEVLFPFGHGLSYTSFEYRGLQLSARSIDENEELTVSVTITNTGQREGQEVVQLYVRDLEGSVFRPKQELKGFAKVRLAPGEARTVSFTLDRRTFAHWASQVHEWKVEAGRFEVRVGASSRDIRLRETVEVNREDVYVPDVPKREILGGYYDLTKENSFSRDGFAALYGRPLPENLADKRGQYTLNTLLGDMHGSPVAWLLGTVIWKFANSRIKDDPDSPMAREIVNFLKYMPLRMMVMFSS
ncbi:MAG: glycoside hydrolase family 3 C-terminal domain-containing protein, partial [Anaerolineales bacterium]